MLTIVPTTSLTIIPGLVKVRKHRSVTYMSFNDLKTSILSAVVVPILVLSSSTVSPSFAETVASKDIVAITSLDKGKQSTVSKEASDRSSLENLSDRVGKNENSIIEIIEDIKDLMKGLNEVKSDLRGTIVLIVVVSTLLLIRSEVNNNEMKKEMKINKAESDAKMAKADVKMAKADAKMDRNFMITTGLSAGALLVSLVMTLANKK